MKPSAATADPATADPTSAEPDAAEPATAEPTTSDPVPAARDRRRRTPGRGGRTRRIPDRRARRRPSLVLDRDGRGMLADWMILIGAVALFGSLFLTWSHQFSHALLVQFGSADALRGIPHNPTAWQVYSVADVVLALLAGALAVVAAAGGRTVRLVISGAAAIALAFALHATTAPPTNGANIVNSLLTPPAYYRNSPGAGIGATVAAIALGIALAGLALSFTSDDR